MTPPHRTKAWRWSAGMATATTVAVLSATALAQSTPPPASLNTPRPVSLRQVFDAAWAHQPQAMALQPRRDAALAKQKAAQAWTPEPMALELMTKTDRLNSNQRLLREVELGVTVPLWLPGERSRSAALAQAEGAAIKSQVIAAQLSLAAMVREAWWQWHVARIEADFARDHVDNTQRIALDVARRMKAGDLALADQHQAQSALASAQAQLAQANASLAAARQHLLALAPEVSLATETADALAEPEPSTPQPDLDAHGSLQTFKDRVAVAEHSAALTAAQSRANPELVLATTRDRGAFGESSQQTITLGLRIPLASGPRSEARSANALAQAAEAQAELALERQRLVTANEAARVKVASSQIQLDALTQRAQLARESRGFFDKSFKLGETDLPTRLRIEAEAAEAERQAARARIELAAAISAWRQALGLLPH